MAKVIRETEREKAMRLTRQMDRLKFKQQKQLAAKSTEIERLNSHVDRGRELLMSVTRRIGEKQSERDYANARLQALSDLLIVIVREEPRFISLAEIKAVRGDFTLEWDNVEASEGVEHGIRLSVKKIDKEDPANDPEQTVVSASDEKDESAGNSQRTGNNETESLPSD